MKALRTNDIAALAAHYKWPVHFVGQILSRLECPGDLWRACKMYDDGTLSIESVNATGTKIDIPASRHSIAAAMWERHNFTIRVKEYYDACERLAMPTLLKTNDGGLYTGHRVVFLDDGRIVAIGTADATGHVKFECANNDVMPNFQWGTLHTWLRIFRRENKTFYKQLKRACYNEPLSTFAMDEKTIKRK